MAVVANFTADVVFGCGPLVVTFTDTSTGSPNAWLWDFGDGSMSNDQNPSHTYTVDGSYEVKLTASIESLVETIPDSSVGEYKLISHSDRNTSYATFMAAAWTPGIDLRGYMVTLLGGLYIHSATRWTQTWDLSAYPSATNILALEVRHAFAIPNIRESNFVSSAGGARENTAGQSREPVLDLTAFGGTSWETDMTDETGHAQLTSPLDPVTNSTGWHVFEFLIRRHLISDKHTNTKTDFVTIGVPVASFTIDVPTAQSPASVGFTNTTPGEGTYSWKRRVSGSGDAFVEFSTEENPTEIFDKLAP